jgi:hypothetical protein
LLLKYRALQQKKQSLPSLRAKSCSTTLIRTAVHVTLTIETTIRIKATTKKSSNTVVPCPLIRVGNPL